MDAYYGNVYAGRVEELLKAPRGGDEGVRQTRAYKVLERVLKHITPLNLLDPRAANFRPEGCRTYHDITRFAHEKAMEELFQVSAGRLDEDGARRLVSTIPLELSIIDLGGGLAPEAADLVQVRPEHLRSRPMLAYWRGVAPWAGQGPKPVDLAGFMSVVMSTATDTNIQERLHEKNFAIITHDYMNLSNRLGFHFATIEAFLGAPGESYVSFTFYGGGAELPRRMRRVRFLTRVLEDLDFRVEPKEDSITARIDGYDADILEEKLEVLGRLMMVSKQLDMVMLSEDAVEQYYREFSQGHIPQRYLGGGQLCPWRRSVSGGCWRVLGILVIVLLALAFVLGIVSLKRTQEIVSDDFQQQQLILAKTTARQIEDGLAFLRRELRILAYSPAIQYLEDVAWANRMQVSFDELSKLGVTAIERIDFTGSAAGQAYVLDAGGPRVIRQDFSSAPEVTWARDPANRGRIYQGPIEVVAPGGVSQCPSWTWPPRSMKRAWTSPIPRPRASWTGCCIFKIDVSAFAGNYCAGIRSGRTGYCWVMNNKGVFLYHPEKEFIGQDAFTARGRRNPAISFAQINEIQKTKMLAGEEGTSRYISGWHRGVIRQMEKFVAFTHANVEPGRAPHLAGGGGGAHRRSLRHHPFPVRAAIPDPGDPHLCPDLRRRGGNLL